MSYASVEEYIEENHYDDIFDKVLSHYIEIKNHQYCTNEIVSGKARSYKLAIKYLCDYLKITQFDDESISKIEKTANVLKDYNSVTYKEVLAFLTKRRQSSYLLKGWINAGVNQFLRFMN